ncbi:small, acid-soluble spore protein, alpha/beta type [Syntrophomonas curvata]
MPAKKKENKPLSARDRMKLEIAQELGILEQVERDGWESLSNAVCGKVGGIMSKRLRERKGDI